MNNAHTNLKLYLDVVWFTSFIMLVCRRRPFYPILNETSVLCSALLLQPLLLLLCCGWCVFSYTKYFLFSRVLFFLLAFISFHFIHTIFCSFVSVDFNPIQLQLIECSHQTSKLTLLCIFKFAATFTFFFSLLLYVYSVFSAGLN